MKIKARGKTNTVTRSQRKGKKYKVTVSGKVVHFGARGYRIKPKTKAGNSYCARSSGIKGKNDITSPNYWSRRMWKCKGKKSILD